MRGHLPNLLPKFIALFEGAARREGYGQVEGALQALEALGAALEDHLQLLLPALVKLISPGEPLHVCGSCFPVSGQECYTALTKTEKANAAVSWKEPCLHQRHCAQLCRTTCGC